MSQDESIKNQLLSHLHEQYAVNDNAKSQNFISFLVSIFVLFGAYGSTAVSVLSSEQKLLGMKLEPNVVIEIFQMLTITISLILFFLSILVVNLGYSTRRDQLVIERIRRKNIEDYNTYFPNRSFSASSKNFWNFLPDYYNLFYWAFIGAELLIMIFTYIIVGKSNCDLKCLTMIIGAATILFSIFIRSCYKDKYNNFNARFN